MSRSCIIAYTNKHNAMYAPDDACRTGDADSSGKSAEDALDDADVDADDDAVKRLRPTRAPRPSKLDLRSALKADKLWERERKQANSKLGDPAPHPTSAVNLFPVKSSLEAGNCVFSMFPSGLRMPYNHPWYQCSRLRPIPLRLRLFGSPPTLLCYTST